MQNRVQQPDISLFAQDLACEFLNSKGRQVLCRNFYTRHGEIDLVFQDQGQLVFCEIKAKYTNIHGVPDYEIDGQKHERFNNAVLEYLTQKNIIHDNYRIDLIAMQMDEATKTCKVRHYKSYY